MKKLFQFHYCEKHKQYQAKRKPRVLCEACWTAYVMKKYTPPYQQPKLQDFNADQ